MVGVGFSWPSLAYAPDRAHPGVHKVADAIGPSSFLIHAYQINVRILQVWLDDQRNSTKLSLFVFLWLSEQSSTNRWLKTA